VNHVELSPQQVKLNAEQERVVLLVEDDPSVLRALRRLAMGAGFKVLTFDRQRDPRSQYSKNRRLPGGRLSPA
jgi:DNA-binding NtrC family response regulator